MSFTQNEAGAARSLTADDIPTVSDRLGSAAVAPPEPRDRASLILLNGENVGALFPLRADGLVVGRAVDANVSLADPSLSPRHARFFGDASGYFVEDLASTTGTYLMGTQIHDAVRVNSGDQVGLGEHLIVRFNLSSMSEEAAAVLIYESSIRDPTSGAYNRHYLEYRLAEAALQPSLAVMLLDVDAFKALNDTHGHTVGDAVLRIIVASVQRNLRPSDTLARFGGDEFVVVCPDTSARNGLILAERLRANIERLPFSAAGNDFSVTVSIGVMHSSDAGGRSLLGAADRALYRAKRRGGNSVVLTS